MTWFPPVNLLFLSFMTIGILISVSAPSWPIAWVGLEINLVSFIPLIINPITNNSANAAVFYFFAQVTGSVLFLIGPIFNNLEILPDASSPLTTGIIIIGLIINLGSAPAHLWFPAVVGRLPFWTGFLLITTQNIAPLALCANLINDLDWTPFIITLGVLNAYLGAHGAYVQSDVRQLLAYSSISHLGWIICLLPLATSYPLIYLAGYIASLLPIIHHFHPIRAISANRFALFASNQPLSSTSVISVFFNLSGLPPFGGFFINIMALTFLIASGHWFVCINLAFASILTLSAYAGLVFIIVINGVSMPSPNSVLRTATAYTLLSVPIIIALPFLITVFFQ